MVNFLAPSSFAQFSTRSGVFTADVNGLIANVPVSGTAISDLVASGCVPVVMSPLANFRNVLDGGDFTVNPWQRNIAGLATSNTNTTTIANTVTYFPDRWFGFGAASSSIQLTQSADTSIPGFSQSCLHSRKATTTDLNPIMLGQVIESLDAIKLQGQAITFSFWARTGANYSGGALTIQIISGTGTAANQTAANMVAGSWTGQVNILNTTQVLTSGMTRYFFPAIVPIGCTQLGVLLTWTPVGTAGTVDGIFFNGLQLEAGGLSLFEHRDIQVELEICQRYTWVVPEPANAVVVGSGLSSASATQQIYMATPVQLRVAPTVTVSTGTFKMNLGPGAVATTITAGGTHTPNAITINGNTASATACAALLTGGGGTGYILASAEF